MSSTVTQSAPSARWRAILAFALVYVMWGSTFLGIRIVVENIPPLMMGGVRFLISGALMLGWMKLRGAAILLNRREMLRQTVIGFLLLTASNVVMGYAERSVPSGLAALISAIVPLWFLLLERIADKRYRIAPRGLAGIAIGVVGVITLLWPNLSSVGRLGLAGMLSSLLALTASFNWALGSVVAKHWPSKADPYTASGWQMFNAGAINLALSLAVGDLHRTVWAARSLWAIAYLVVAGSLVGYTAYVWLLRNIPTHKVATYAYVNPIVAVFLGWLILGEKITPLMVGGSAIVVVSVVLVTGARTPGAEPDDDAEPLESAGD